MGQFQHIITEQIGWQKCVACSDSRTHPGEMWLGSVKGAREYIVCPVCHGERRVPLVRYRDLQGREIEPERIGREVPLA